jgi:hypothetical protein
VSCSVAEFGICSADPSGVVKKLFLRYLADTHYDLDGHKFVHFYSC